MRGSALRLVARQLGREPQAAFEVVARCHDGHPLVVRNHPVDRSGNPFPTLYWLTCPAATKAVSRLEAEGWIGRLADRAEADPNFGAALARAHDEHARDRGRFVPDASGWGGVGGARAGVKCLHAHYANHLAGGRDPVGAWVAERVEPVHAEAPTRRRVAAVDIGTNSIRLLVADERGGAVDEIARDLLITRLGQGVDDVGRIDPEALRRTMSVLERYVVRARALGASEIRVAATSAVRDATDRAVLEREVERLAGVGPEVLSGTREAELSFLGATTGLDAEPPYLVFDIGGGSTEIVVGSAEPEATASVDIGSVRLTERVRPSDPPSESDVARMEDIAAALLAPAEHAVPAGRAATLVGVAGTTTTVQAIALGLDRYDPEAINGSILRLEDARRVARELARMTVADRRAVPVMTPGREDVIVAGSVILVEIFQRWRFDACIVSERDLLDGLAIDAVRAATPPVP
ncbi:MAG TPA: DUF501 domain-containing protein [Actinomycetota bacterium]|nr:DUF501 domain-containing protein [Actinomycetota bacterium]